MSQLIKGSHLALCPGSPAFIQLYNTKQRQQTIRRCVTALKAGEPGTSLSRAGCRGRTKVGLP